MKDLSSGNIYKNFILFAIPLILAALFSQTYNTVDTIIAGKFIGEEGLAATGATAPLITFLSSPIWGFGTGAGIYFAKLFGSKDYKVLKSAIISNMAVIFAVSEAVGILTVILKTPIFALLRVPYGIKTGASAYFIIYMLGFGLIMLNTASVYTMNALGCSSFPFFMSMLAAAVNIGGNILCVAVFRIGVAGLAISTVTACTAAQVCYTVKILSCFREMGVADEKVHFSIGDLKKTCRYSLPVCIQQTVMYVSSLMISPIVNGISVAAAASYTVELKLYDIISTFYQNSSKTLSNFAAHCIGAGKYERIRKGLFAGLVQGIVFTLPLVTVCCIFSKEICLIFFPSGFTGEALSLASAFARYCLPFVMFNMINNLFHSYCRGIVAMNMLIISTLIGSVTRIVMTVAAVKYCGVYGVFIGWAASWIAEALFMTVSYFRHYRSEEKLMKHIQSI